MISIPPSVYLLVSEKHASRYETKHSFTYFHGIPSTVLCLYFKKWVENKVEICVVLFEW